MSSRLSDVNARIETLRQLGSVITAIRGIAAARARERLTAVEAYARIVGDAIGEALSLLPDDRPGGSGASGSDQTLLLAFCAEQGFAGAFSRKVLEEARSRVGEAEFLLVGARGQIVTAELDLPISWFTPMVTNIDQIVALADRLVAYLDTRLAEGLPAKVLLAYARPVAGGVQTMVNQLLPFDFTRFPRAANVRPLTTLPPPLLARKLAQEHVFAELCDAILCSYAAENEARTLALLAAHTNVDRKHDALVGEARRLRQDEITNELVELAAGAAALKRRGDGTGNGFWTLNRSRRSFRYRAKRIRPVPWYRSGRRDL